MIEKRTPFLNKFFYKSVLVRICATFVLLILALPPFNIWPLGFIVLVPWLSTVVDYEFPRKNVFLGSVFLGALFYILFHYVYLLSAPYPWLGIPASIVWGTVIGILLVLGLLYGFGWAFYAWMSDRLIGRYSVYAPVILSAFWVFLELVLSYLNWNTGLFLGYLIPPQSVFGQLASVGGVWLVSFLLILVNWFVVFEIKKNKSKSFYFLPFLVLFVWAIVGTTLYFWVYFKTGEGDILDVIAIQASSKEKYSQENQQKYDALIKASQRKIIPSQLLVLPETTYVISSKPPQWLAPNSFYFTSIDGLKNYIKPLLQKNSVALVGFVEEGSRGQLYNGAILVDDEDSRVYYKQSLFPFGEYLPFKNLWSSNLQSAFRFESRDDQEASFSRVAYKDISTIFCNEVFNSFLVGKYVQNNTPLISVLASDYLVGTPQYADLQLRVAGYRAVENWRPLVLSASRARSAIFGVTGNSLAATQYSTDAFINARIANVGFRSIWNRTRLLWIMWWLVVGFYLILVGFKKRV